MIRKKRKILLKIKIIKKILLLKMKRKKITILILIRKIKKKMMIKRKNLQAIQLLKKN